MRLRTVLSGLLVAAALPLSAAITLEEIRSNPPSLARNFMIWQYFDQDITPKQADEAFYLIKDVNRKMFLAYAEKSDRPEVAYTVACMKLGIKDLLESPDPSCARLGASIGKLSAMKAEERLRIAKFVGEPELMDAAVFLNDANLSDDYRQYPPGLFLKVFNGSYGNARRSLFDFSPDADYMNALAKSSGFTSALMSAINDPALSKFAAALTKVSIRELDARGHFYLGLNQLRYGTKAKAIEHFQLSRDKAYYQSDKDKALFWHALVTQNDLIWKNLAASWDINFYSLYARQKTGSFPDNFFTQLQTSEKTSDLNLSNPFVWNELLQTIRQTPKARLYDLAQTYDAANLTPLQSFIVERASDYRLQSYIMPYDDSIGDLDNDTKAMLYALMRQESRFIPAALSGSFALGLMQMMPFLVKAMDKDVDADRQTLADMFDPEMNLRYAVPHLKWLQARVYHPLFIAYAYNGGIGFTKRHLINNDCFVPGKYEPFMSMELMRRTETREYGKKVLTNYVVYKQILGEPVSLIELCDTLLLPSKTDRFRTSR